MNGTVLLTEDDRDISDLIKVYLRGFSGLKLLHARTAEESLRMVQGERIDLALLDINLHTDLGGFDILKYIRTYDVEKLRISMPPGLNRFQQTELLEQATLTRKKQVRGMSVLMLTASRNELDVHRARRWRANGYMLKPVEKFSLLRRMRPLLPI